eukprot:TRINITY_DN10269_c0_g1_i5.p1 TRINITY_DN10269_c0_g1~~TRINITY_DN10269_c0_g1_i5.p1  ORF type:complete len:649 (+),score=78.10 TRINITY_DN10269_c0_g1_i5:65-1948(+)
MGFYHVYDTYLAPYICVYYPKYVRLRDQRLGWFLNFLRVSVFAVIAYFLQDERPWYEVHVPVGFTGFWIEGTDVEERHASDLNSDLCDPAKRAFYDYQYDEAGVWTYFNNTCRQPSVAVSAIKGEREMFIPTYVADFLDTSEVVPMVSSCNASCTSLPPCLEGYRFEPVSKIPEHVTLDGNDCYCSCRSRQTYFYTGVEGLFFFLGPAASYKKPQETWELTLRASKKSDNLKTVVRDHGSGQILKTFTPGSTVFFSVGELLKFAGVSLMDPADFTNQNWLTTPGTVTYPPLKLTGLKLDINIDFWNIDGKGLKEYDHDGPMCFIDVVARPAWTDRPLNFHYASSAEFKQGVGTERLKYMYGIRIVPQSTGTFSFISYLQVFYFLASCAVYFTLPMFIMHVLMWFFLGDLTDRMDTVLHETPDWNRRFANFVAQALLAKFFHAKMMTEETLDDTIRDLARAYHKDDGSMQDADLETMWHIVKGARQGDVEKHRPAVTETEFMCAFTQGETIGDVWKMFDANRKRPLLQRLLDGNLLQRMELVKSVRSSLQRRIFSEMPRTHMDHALVEGAEGFVELLPASSETRTQMEYAPLEGEIAASSPSAGNPSGLFIAAERQELDATLRGFHML